MSKNAYIYLLEHSSNPNICKVGKTRVSVKSRADSYAGGVFTECCKWKVDIEDLDDYEIKAHKELTKYKVPEIGYREIFSINPKEAKIKLDRTILTWNIKSRDSFYNL